MIAISTYRAILGKRPKGLFETEHISDAKPCLHSNLWLQQRKKIV